MGSQQNDNDLQYFNIVAQKRKRYQFEQDLLRS